MKENRALVREIASNIPGVIIGRVKENVKYKLSYDASGDGTMRFWIVEENAPRSRVAINRICDVTAGHYEYNFISKTDGIITYHIRGGSAENITLIEE